MRRPLAAAVVAALLAAPLPLAAPAAHGEPTGGADRGTDPALEVATGVLAGDRSALPPGAASATLAMRDLFRALPRLDAEQRRHARALLARPTQGADDPQGDGYTVPARRTCAAKVCVHWVRSTADAPPGRRWVTRTLKVMRRTWAREVGDLGYRPPVSDRGRGGNRKFDVYLKDVGRQGLYGYCVPERRQPGWRWRASGYCVLDDDFARSQYGAKPLASLRVTAAHEFFHAVQFGYDYAEDRWLMEASATWMEERVADDVDDNRQYLPYGQVRRPAVPLDRFDPSGFGHYGNWAFFEHLSGRFGDRFVRTVWETAQDRKDQRSDPYSTLALRRSLPRQTTFPQLFADYAAANTVPAASYPEGHSWPSAPAVATHDLDRDTRSAQGSVRVDHLASKTVAARPGDGLQRRGWRLRVSVDGPARKTGPAAVVVVRRADGGLLRRPVALDAEGTGSTTVGFSGRTVDKVTVTLANASTRFRCWRRQETYSCQGVPRDDGRRFGYRLRVVAP